MNGVTIIAALIAFLSLTVSIVFGIITLNNKNKDNDMVKCKEHRDNADRKFDNIWEKLKDHDRKFETQIKLEEKIENIDKQLERLTEKIDKLITGLGK